MLLFHRFDSIKWNFHICSNNDLIGQNLEKYDKLFKIRKLYDHVILNCLAIEPEEYNSIDEQMIPYKGKKVAYVNII